MATARADQDTVHFVTRGINLKTTASTQIVPASKTSRRFVVQKVYLIVSAATSFTVAPTVRVNGTGSGDIAASQTPTAFGQFDVFDMTLVTPPFAWNIATGFTAISLQVTAGATATTATGEVHVIGFYI